MPIPTQPHAPRRAPAPVGIDQGQQQSWKRPLPHPVDGARGDPETRGGAVWSHGSEKPCGGRTQGTWDPARGAGGAHAPQPPGHTTLEIATVLTRAANPKGGRQRPPEPASSLGSVARRSRPRGRGQGLGAEQGHGTEQGTGAGAGGSGPPGSRGAEVPSGSCSRRVSRLFR